MEHLTTSTEKGRQSGYRQKKILDFAELPQLRERLPRAKILLCHGVFDVIHAGHLAYFESAKKMGDILVVTITADPYVNKGPGRPYFNSHIRTNMLAALEVIDYVAVSHFPTAVPAIEALKPDLYVKGPDYKDKAADLTGGIYEEERAVEKGGGKLALTEDATFSSSSLINGFFKIWSEEQQTAIDKIRKAGGLSLVEEVLEKLSFERVRVIGEPIVDSYVFCTPESISSKSPSISARHVYEEDYAGGSLAIANHLSDFVKEVSLLTTHGGEPYFKEILSTKMDKRVNLIYEELPNIPTPRKTRFITADTYQRIFEVTNLRSDQWTSHSPQKFAKLVLDSSYSKDTTIIADFGHGLFEGSVLSAVGDLSGFVALNVQTNSSNLGFNPFNKHKKFSFLSIDAKEARVAYHDRFTPPIDIARRIRSDYSSIGCALSVTLGPHGALYFPQKSKDEISAPAFTDKVIDATGAGDAFFAMSSMLVKVGCPPLLVPFIGNIFAGLKTKVIGNKFSVTKAQLHKALTAILK